MFGTPRCISPYTKWVSLRKQYVVLQRTVAIFHAAEKKTMSFDNLLPRLYKKTGQTLDAVGVSYFFNHSAFAIEGDGGLGDFISSIFFYRAVWLK